MSMIMPVSKKIVCGRKAAVSGDSVPTYPNGSIIFMNAW
jgi:hypothetical protein